MLLDSVAISAWLNAHRTETAAGLAAYLATSCLTGLLTGIFLAVHTLNRDKGILRFLFRGRLGAWFAQHEVRGVVSDEPMIFSALRPEMGENGRTKAVWVEAELRDAHGIYTGLVASYSMGRDDSAHKLLLLENVLYIPTRESEYEPVPNQSVLLDMADVLVLRIEQRPRKLDSPAPKPPQMPHNFEDSETSTIEEA